VPGSSARMAQKAAGCGADMVILDLEDAVAPSEKVEARAVVVDAIRSHDWGDGIVAVRVNDWTSPWTVADLLALVAGCGDRLDVVVLPKADGPDMVRALDLVLAQLELDAGRAPGAIGIDAQIESARAVQALGPICASSSRLQAIALGPLDLAASLGMPADVEHGRRRLDPVASAMVVAARSAGIQVVDGPYVQIRDLEGLRSDAEWAVEIGFDGKWALHPDQVAPIQEAFSPSAEALVRAKRVMEVYDAATRGEGRGALLVDGEMVDEASCRIARKVVERGRRAGAGMEGREGA
jgi:citrate lyase subunit beta/citryl-CoA lyase